MVYAEYKMNQNTTIAPLLCILYDAAMNESIGTYFEVKSYTTIVSMVFHHKITIWMHVYVDCTFTTQYWVNVVFLEKFHHILIIFTLLYQNLSFLYRTHRFFFAKLSIAIYARWIMWKPYLPNSIGPVFWDLYSPLFGFLPTFFKRFVCLFSENARNLLWINSFLFRYWTKAQTI